MYTVVENNHLTELYKHLIKTKFIWMYCRYTELPIQVVLGAVNFTVYVTVGRVLKWKTWCMQMRPT